MSESVLPVTPIPVAMIPGVRRRISADDEPEAAAHPVRLVLDARGSLREAARRCEAEVLRERYGTTPEQLEQEFRPYEDASVLLAVTDDRNQVLGTARVIVPSVAGFRVLADLGRSPWYVDGRAAGERAGLDPETTWELAGIAIRASVRSRGLPVAAALLHGVVAGMAVNGVRWLVAMLDDETHRVLDAHGLVPQALPGTWPAPHLGSPVTTPVFAQYDELVEGQRLRAPDAWRRTTYGDGVDAVELPAPRQLRLPPGRAPSPAVLVPAAGRAAPAVAVPAAGTPAMETPPILLPQGVAGRRPGPHGSGGGAVDPGRAYGG